MKYIAYILTLLMGLFTSFFIWLYIHRANLDYNSEGRFFSPENGVVYHEQTKEVYGMVAFLGFVLTGLFLIKLIKRKTQMANRT